MYQQVFGCCGKGQEGAGNGHTIEVVTVENRFEGGTTVIGGPSKDPAIFLTPGGKTQTQTVWRTNAVAQPVHVVFTYSNRANQVRSVAGPSQQITTHHQITNHQPIQTITIQQQQSHINDIHNLPIVQAPRPGGAYTTGNFNQTTTTREFGYQQRSVTEHTIVQKTWQEQRQVRQEHLQMQNFNTFGPVRSVDTTHSPPRADFVHNYGRVKSPVSTPTPIDILQHENRQHQQQYFPHALPTSPFNHQQIGEQKQRIQSSTVRTFQPQGPPTGGDKKSNAEESPSALVKKKVAPKKQGKRIEKRDTSRSQQSESSTKKSKDLSAPHSKLEADKKRLAGVSSAKKLTTKPINHQSDRLLEHRPCGRRHCTACQLKKKAEAASAAKLKTTK